MKFLPLIWSGIWRKRERTILTILQVCVAFCLFGVLQGLKTGVDRAIADARADLLMVHSRTGISDPLPLAYRERIKSVPGVKVVSIENDLIGMYQKPTQQIIAVAIIPDQALLAATPQFRIEPEQFAALARTRTGALASAGLARKYGWKIGDRITLISPLPQSNGSPLWDFDIVGTFTFHELLSLSDFLVINNDYFDEARLAGKGTVRHFTAVISDPKQAAAVADEIDRQFANSSSETRTESLRELAQSEMQSIGDLDFVIRAIVGAMLFALLLSTASAMMQSIHERRPELAVLKTLGFTDRAVSLLLLCEAVTVFIVAAALGLAAASVAFPFAATIVPGVSMPGLVMAGGLLLALIVALVSVALPAWRASQQEVAHALAGR